MWAQEMISSLRFRLKGADAEPQVTDGHLFLQGERTWLLEGEPDDILRAQAALGRLSTWLTDGLLEVNFGNTVGFVDVPGLAPVEIVSGKWGHTQFDQMLMDLTVTASALPFAASGSGALPYDRTAAEVGEVLYHGFVYLRYIMSEAAPADERLPIALQVVLQDPHRHLQRTRERVPIERAFRIDTASLTRVSTGQEQLVELKGGAYASLPLAQVLRGYLPPSVEHVRIESTYDTPENRFVKAFLDQAVAIVRRVSDLTRADTQLPDALATRLRAESERLILSLCMVQRHPMWREVGPMSHLPAGSTVLQRRRGYREIYRHFGRLRNAMRIPIDAQSLRRLLEIRDIAELYELWCYFALVRLISVSLRAPAIADIPTANEFGLTVRRDFSVSWPGGFRLFYNRGYSRSQAVSRRSYSVPLRPDIAFEVPTGKNHGLHLLDAKFRLDQLTGWEPDQDSDERLGIFKRADIYKMHTYRDAIPSARSVWVLYPGTETRFYPESDDGILHTLDAKEQLILDGVGAVPLVPGSADAPESEISRLVRLLVTNA